MDKKTILKRFITLLLVSIVIFFIGKLLVEYINSGTLSIKTNADNRVTIIVKDSDGRVVINSKTTEVSKRLYKGLYVIEVLGENDSKSRTSARVNPRETTEQYLGIANTMSPLLTSRTPVAEINEASNGAYFLQANAHLLKKYDEKSLNQPAIKTDLQQVSKIDLSDSGFGYVMTYDKLFYSVRNNKSTNIRETLLSDIETLDTPRDLDYSPKSKELFMSAGKKIYRVKKGESKAEHIYTAPWPITKISYNGNGSLMIAQYPEEDNSNNEEYGDPVEENYSVALLDTQTKQLAEIDKQPIIQSADWSPNGKYLAYSVGNALRIYDSSNKAYIRDVFLDNNIPSETNWCDNDKLVFSDGSGVWSNTIEEGGYNVFLAKLSNVSALSCNNQGTIYVGTFKQPRNGGLYRLSDLNQSDKDLVTSLNSSTPYYGAKMMLDYVQTGGKKPTVVVKIFMPRDLLHVKKGQKGYLSAVVIKNQAKEEAKQKLITSNIKPESVNMVYLVNY